MYLYSHSEMSCALINRTKKEIVKSYEIKKTRKTFHSETLLKCHLRVCHGIKSTLPSYLDFVGLCSTSHDFLLSYRVIKTATRGRCLARNKNIYRNKTPVFLQFRTVLHMKESHITSQRYV